MSTFAESERDARALAGRRVNPVKAKVDLLIKQKLDKKSEGGYKRGKRNNLDTIEYYDYDGDEEQETRGAMVNEIKNGDAGFLVDDQAKLKRGMGAMFRKKSTEGML